METLGSLLDKYSISKIRLENSKKICDENNIKNIENQSKKIKDEIDIYLYNAINNNVELEEQKFKIYKNEKPSGEEFSNISSAIERLFDSNITLWNLEDKRRDKSYSDKEIREICDDVAKYNRIRNDCIDYINKLFSKMILEKK